MPKKRIFKNHCNKCNYRALDPSDEPCQCGIHPCDDDNGKPGCNYKESTLRKLCRYTEVEFFEDHNRRISYISNRWEQAANNIEEKAERGEKISEQEEHEFYLLSKDLELANMLAFDHKRCNYIRIIKVLDEKGEFKRLLRKLGRYPEFIDDFTIFNFPTRRR